MRVAILYDVEGWAQHRHAVGLQSHAGPEFEVRIGRIGRSQQDLFDWAECVYVIYFASARRAAGKIVASCIASHAWKHEFELPESCETWGVTRTRNLRTGLSFLSQCDVAVCRNTSLESWATENGHPRAKYIPAGVDLSMFNARGRKPRSGKLRVGWCGQTAAPFKGYEVIYRPLRSLLGEADFEWHEITHSFETAHSPEQMAYWYKNIDVFITTAADEGTPNPPFEAAACGCVVLSTDMGQPADWDTLRKCGLLLPTYRSLADAASVIDNFARKLTELRDADLQQIQETILESIEREYSYDVITPRLLKFIGGVDADC